MGTQQQKPKARRTTRKKPVEQPPLPGHPIKLGGDTYYVKPPSRDGIAEFEKFVLDHRLSPLDIAKSKLEGLTPEQQRDLLREALARESSMPNAITEADFAAALDTREGAAMMFWLMIRENHPGITLERIETIVENATETEFQRLLDQRDSVPLED